MTGSDSDDFPGGEELEAFNTAVRDTAYFLWEQDGRPEGRADEYWHRALDFHARQRVNDEALRDNVPKGGEG